MIAASWPMPDSFIPNARKESEEDFIVKDTINVLNQKKGQLKDVLSQSEKIILQNFLNDAIKELASKALVKSLTESLKGQITTHDLDDLYAPKGKIPFPKYKQPSLFEVTDDEPF
jgi:ubiquinone biosynthesis protein Coq4